MKTAEEKQKAWDKIIETLKKHHTLSGNEQLSDLGKELDMLIQIPIVFIDAPNEYIDNDGITKNLMQKFPNITDEDIDKQTKLYFACSRILKSYENCSLIKSHPFVYIHSLTLTPSNSILIRLIEHNFGKKKVTFTISENIYNQFIKKADSLAINKSKFVENRIKEFLNHS